MTRDEQIHAIAMDLKIRARICGHATAQKQVDFKVEQTPDGNVSVSVRPFQFKAEPTD
jgi:hypothetical protein